MLPCKPRSNGEVGISVPALAPLTLALHTRPDVDGTIVLPAIRGTVHLSEQWHSFVAYTAADLARVLPR